MLPQGTQILPQDIQSSARVPRCCPRVPRCCSQIFRYHPGCLRITQGAQMWPQGAQMLTPAALPSPPGPPPSQAGSHSRWQCCHCPSHGASHRLWSLFPLPVPWLLVPTAWPGLGWPFHWGGDPRGWGQGFFPRSRSAVRSPSARSKPGPWEGWVWVKVQGFGVNPCTGSRGHRHTHR